MAVGIAGMKLGDAYVSIGARMGPFNTAMRTIEAQLTRVGSRLQAAGRSFTMLLSAPAAMLGGVSVKAFSDFDSAMTQSTAIMGDLSEAMRTKMEEQAKRMSTEVTFRAREMAQAYYFLASAGLDAAASVEALPVVARFAQAGMFDMAKATDLLTDAQSALGMTIRNDAIANMENMTILSDVLVKANTLANASVEQFSEALTTKAGPVLKAFNKDAQEGVAVLAAMADQGIKASHAGTSLSIIMNRLAVAAVDNQEAYKKYGVEVYNAQGNMRHMADIIRDFEDALGGAGDKQQTMMLSQMGFTARSVAFIKALIGTSDAIRRYDTELRRAQGTTQEVVEKQLRSFPAQMALLRNRIQLAGIALGEHLAPVVRRVGNWIARLTDRFRSMNERMQGVVAKTLAFAVALGPALILLGSFVKLIAQAARGLAMLRTTLGIVFSSTVVGTIVAAAAAIAGLAALIASVAYEGDTFGERWKAMTEDVTGFWKEKWQTVTDWWKKNSDSVWDGVALAVFQFKQAFDISMTMITLTIANVSRYIVWFGKQVWADLKWLGESVKNFYTGLTDYLGELFFQLWQKIKNPTHDFEMPSWGDFIKGANREYVEKPKYFDLRGTWDRMNKEAGEEAYKFLQARIDARMAEERAEEQSLQRRSRRQRRFYRRQRREIEETTNKMREGFWAADEFSRELQRRVLQGSGAVSRATYGANQRGGATGLGSGRSAVSGPSPEAQILGQIYQLFRRLAMREPIGVFGASV